MQIEKQADKPPYRVPTMEEIRGLPWSGFNAISTFSGAGGSCLGYRMAGFRVLWANEIIPESQATYRAMHPNSIICTKDIRTIETAKILDAIGMRSGELDLMDGSPPCTSFSSAGKREKGWGEVSKYSGTNIKQRVDDLFFEYARILEGLQPKCFVAENVSGLVRGTAKGYFKLILARLRDCGYQVKCKVLDAQWLGVPQTRSRIIFVGVRNDLGVKPAHPKPWRFQYSVREAIPWISNAEHNTSGLFSKGDITNRPCPCVTQSEGAVHLFAYGEPETDISRYEASVTHQIERRKFSIAELKRICAFPDDYEFAGSYSQQWAQMGRAVPPLMMKAIAETVRDEILIRLSCNLRGRNNDR